MTPPIYLAWLLGAYLVGSIPFGLVIGRAKGVDIRDHGSGNVGATNVGRVLGKKLGLTCFVLDVLKGLIPVLAYGLTTDTREVIASGSGAQWLVAPDTPSSDPTMVALLWLAIAAAAVVGHVFPVWLKFKGGKGVATSLGVLLGVFPYLTLPALLGFGVWYLTLKLSRYVGLASVVTAVVVPLFTIGSGLMWGLERGPIAVFTLVTTLLAALVIFRHRGNIQRIRAGTEPKVGSPKTTAA